jgi:hypothetical protein
MDIITQAQKNITQVHAYFSTACHSGGSYNLILWQIKQNFLILKEATLHTNCLF